MDLTFSLEQEQLRDSVRRYLADHDFSARREAAVQRGRQSELWLGLVRDLGVMGIGVHDVADDPTGGAIERMIVAEELGRALSLEPYCDVVAVAGTALADVGGTFATDVGRGIASGETMVAPAFYEPGMRYALEWTATTAIRTDDDWRIDGEKTAVAAAPFADFLLVSARTGGSPGERTGLSLFLLDTNTPGLTRHGYPTIDGRRAADVTLRNVTTRREALLGEEGAAAPLLDLLLDRGIAAITAEGVGTMRRALAETFEYTSVRRQFGRTLAEMQALQHRMTDMFVHVELASAAALLASLKLSAPRVERRRATSAAKVTLDKAMRFVGQNAIQLHGGMGMTGELTVAHAFKRMTMIAGDFGTVDHHLQRYRQ